MTARNQFDPCPDPDTPHTLPESPRPGDTMETFGIGDPTTPEIAFGPPDEGPPKVSNPEQRNSDTPPTIVQVDRPAQLRAPGSPEVPGYVVIEEIARGGMGVVYAAEDLALGREVAIKTLLPELNGNWQMASQFDREARITARLPHPGIPAVYALGLLSDGRPFLVMKLIRGRTLGTIVKHRPSHDAATDSTLPGAMDFHGLLQVFEQVCQAVGFAHSQAIIHRDLKPANVMVGSFGEVQVMDWGLARTLDSGLPEVVARRGEGPKATRSGEPKGTPAYMPPEQARGDWQRVDARADVFALGGILTAILTGAPPYSGGRPLDLLRRAAAADLSEAYRRLDLCGVDRELVTLAKACLSPDPVNRPADAGVVAGLMASYRLGREERLRRAEARRAAVAARPDHPGSHAHTAERREAIAEILHSGDRMRWRVRAALAVALGLVAGSVGAAWWYERGPGVRQPAHPASPCQFCPCSASSGG